MTARSAESARLGGPLVVSAVLHGGLIALAMLARPEAPPQLPPVYRVTLKAVPPGPRQAGVVRPPQTPAPTPPAPTPEAPAPTPPRAPETPPPQTMPTPNAPPARQAPRATPNPTPEPPRPAAEPARPARPSRPAPAPTAGGGPQGGRGTDVANINLRGIEFPYPGYLQNIVRQIVLQFDPPDRNAPLSAEVVFNIQRDGTVQGIRFVSRSGDYDFDTEALGAVERAGPRFGRLPEGYPDDVLTVYFRFDPKIIR